MIELMLVGLLLVFLGLLLGTTWTSRATQSQIRRQAEERRRLNEEWAAIRAAQRQQTECLRCGGLLYEQNGYFVPTGVEDRPDDDYAVRARS